MSDVPTSKPLSTLLAGRAVALALCLTLGPLDAHARDGGTVLCFGDSIAAGSELPADARQTTRWPALVEQLSSGRWREINESRGGRSTDALEEFAGAIARHRDPTVIVLALGTNDSRRLDAACVADAVARLRQMVALVRAERPAARLLILAPPNLALERLRETKPIGPQRDAQLRALEAAFRTLAHEEGTEFVSLYGTLPPETLRADGVHPNEAGNRALATIVHAALERRETAEALDSLAEYHVRGGLPRVAAKIAAGGEVRVAFLGGSITAADGWRVHLMENLQSEHPRAKFTAILAAVPGTGSDYGAARLRRDVLRHRPDLLLVEFAVNDGHGSARVEAQIEGIVRQARAANPDIELCFLYTVAGFQLPELLGGQYPSSARSMERVAEHYQIPSFNFGVAVARALQRGELVVSAPAADPVDSASRDGKGRLVFTHDDVHPTPVGHRFYAARLAPALAAFFQHRNAAAAPLPPPLQAGHWQAAQFVPVSAARPDAQWRLLAADALPSTKQRELGLVPPTWVTFAAGAAIEFRFRGTAFGLVGLKGPDNGEFRVTVDDLPAETGTFFDSYSTPGHYYLKTWFYPAPLYDGEHRVRVELLASKLDKAAILAKAGKSITPPEPFLAHGVYLCGFAVVGEWTAPARPAAE